MQGRPAIIYLDAPLTLHGIAVHHTQAGLVYLIEHYEHILKISTPQQLGPEGRAHIGKLLENYKIHLELYERNIAPGTPNT